MNDRILISLPRTIFIYENILSAIILIMNRKYLCGIGVWDKLEGHVRRYIANNIAFVVCIVLLHVCI